MYADLSLQHTGLLSAALLSFLTLFLVGVGFQLYARRAQDLQPAIQLFFFALVFLILDAILPLKVLKSDGQRNAVSATDTEQQTDIINIMPGSMGSVVYPAVLCSGQVCLSTCQTTWKKRVIRIHLNDDETDAPRHAVLTNANKEGSITPSCMKTTAPAIETEDKSISGQTNVPCHTFLFADTSSAYPRQAMSRLAAPSSQFKAPGKWNPLSWYKLAGLRRLRHLVSESTNCQETNWVSFDRRVCPYPLGVA